MYGIVLYSILCICALLRYSLYSVVPFYTKLGFSLTKWKHGLAVHPSGSIRMLRSAPKLRFPVSTAGKHRNRKPFFDRAPTRTTMSYPDIALDRFAYRHFDDPHFTGTRVTGISKEDFMSRVLNYYEKRAEMQSEYSDRPTLIDGYAPFCKHLFMPNFLPDVVTPCIEVTKENEHLLRTKYEARKSSELPVLIRYFPADLVKAPACKYLDLILYSREQIVKESAATGDYVGDLGRSPWRLISIKAQDVPHETPMQPITLMRNALISEGGSGVQINRKAYMASVAYWSKHATIA